MDLNYLFACHQVSLMRADAAVCSLSRRRHLGMASAFAGRMTPYDNGLERKVACFRSLRRNRRDPPAVATDETIKMCPAARRFRTASTVRAAPKLVTRQATAARLVFFC